LISARELVEGLRANRRASPKIEGVRKNSWGGSGGGAGKER